MKKIFRTGQVCEESGIYEVVGDENISPDQKHIPLTKGERFPPCKGCADGDAEWVLVRAARANDKS